MTLAKELPAKLTRGAAAAVAARHREVELRVSAQRQERQRPQPGGRLRGAGAAELRDLLHRAVRQPGDQLDADRGRPVEERQAQGASAEHDRRRQLSGHGARPRPRTPPPRPRWRSRSPASRGCRSPAATAWCRSRAEAGKETTIPILITNTGTAPADEVELTSTAPSGWKIAFEPKTIDRIAPGQNKEVQALVTPPEKAMAGDYAPTLQRRLARRDRLDRSSASRSRPRPCGASSAPASSPSRC